jgi:hypothetical protein
MSASVLADVEREVADLGRFLRKPIRLAAADTSGPG